MKVKKDDKVLVIAGKAKGKTAPVIEVNVVKGKIKLEGINKVTRHIKPRAGRPGERVEKEAFVDVSNVMVVCPSCAKPTRVGYAMKDNKKLRSCKKCKTTFA